MEALVARLSRLDSDAEGALRVVTFFDTLMRRRVDLPALARAAAGLAECPVGIRLRGAHQPVLMAPDGQPATEPQTASTEAAVLLDEETIGTVWLERPGPAGGLDQLVLDRLALAVAAAVERYGPAHTTMADPALVELAVSADIDDAARDRALRLLGFDVGRPLRVVAVRSELPLDRVATAICPEGPVRAAQVGGVGAVLVGATAPARLPADTRAGIGGAQRPALSWQQARTALRFATDRQPVVHYDDLGALALLADLPETARDNADVRRIAEIALQDGDLRTLDAYCATGSLRGAAQLLHLHHSSVARRIDQLGRMLGVDLTAPAGLLRASMALTAWRVLDG